MASGRRKTAVDHRMSCEDRRGTPTPYRFLKDSVRTTSVSRFVSRRKPSRSTRLGSPTVIPVAAEMRVIMWGGYAGGGPIAKTGKCGGFSRTASRVSREVRREVAAGV